MKRFAFSLLCVAMATVAQAQRASRQNLSLYVAGAGGVTSNGKAVWGVEAGLLEFKGLHPFVEIGRMVDAKTDDLTSAAAVITNVLGQFGAASSTAKEPVTYYELGIRQSLFSIGPVSTGALLAIGLAHVTKDVKFFVNGTDVTSQLLNTFGVQLGEDLAGSQNRFMLELGADARFPIVGPVFGDFAYRYAPIFMSEGVLNTNRFTLAAGFRF